MTKLQLHLFLESKSDKIVSLEHIDQIHGLIKSMTSDVKDKFIALNLYDDMKDKNVKT